MADLKPFDDVPHKLGVQLRRSFVATRTFYLALQKGAVVAENMLAMRLEEECGKEIAEMRYCGLCRRESNPRACLGHCTGVVEKCLRHLQILDSDWNKYIGEYNLLFQFFAHILLICCTNLMSSKPKDEQLYSLSERGNLFLRNSDDITSQKLPKLYFFFFEFYARTFFVVLQI